MGARYASLVLAAAALAACPSWAGTGYTVTWDIPYATVAGVDPELLSLDVYVPDPLPARPMPVVVWVHGGGWAIGDKTNQMEHKPPLLTGAGYCLVSINYRLSPYPPSDDPGRIMYPIHERDAAAAVAWVHAHIAAYGGDPGRIALMGHSAGAHLVSLIATDQRFLAEHGLGPADLRGVVSLDTAGYDIPRHLDGNPSPLYLNAFGDDPAVWAEASPVDHLAPGTGIPPFLLICRGSASRHEICNEFARGLAAIGDPPVVVDASQYTHAEVNRAVGAPGETVVTPPLMAFLARIFGAGPPRRPGRAARPTARAIPAGAARGTRSTRSPPAAGRWGLEAFHVEGGGVQGET